MMRAPTRISLLAALQRSISESRLRQRGTQPRRSRRLSQLTFARDEGGDVQSRGGRTLKVRKKLLTRPKATRGRSCFALPFGNGRSEFRRDLFAICDDRLHVRAQLVAS